MRPGPHPIATNNTWAAGPAPGTQTKLAYDATMQTEGYYPEYRIASRMLNWQLYRNALIQQFAAKMFASNYTLKDSGAVPAGGETLMASCSMKNATTAMTISLFFGDTGIGNIVERVSRDGVNWFVPGSSPIAAPGQPCASLDADSDNVQYRAVVASAPPATALVYYNLNFAGTPWNAAAGVAAKDWLSIGCDGGSTGGAILWLIGDSGAGGTIAPVLYGSSPTPAAFANVAGFPGLAVGNQINFIGHTCHPAGALGPDDTGNPSWLVLTTAPAGAGRSLYSTDGATWNNAAHGMGAWQINKKSAAYSRTSRKWVAVDTTGNIWQSVDNGATWTTAVTLPIFAGTVPQIRCDGYGTFVVADIGTRIWVSTDEAVSWTRVEMENTAGYTRCEVECAFDQDANYNQLADHPTCFTVSYHQAGVLLETFRSLVY